ncbi:cytochrome b [Salinisphaera sp. SPP-AMP-43]|uniref:cytochrome b n=1 Tax=Salinisphaera sp. SPP-AMP-43 TaxID=3121288 RepID=UPI003C6E0577
MGVLSRQHHYHPAAKAFHWLVAVLVFVIWPLGFFGGMAKSGVSSDIYLWHESLGFAVFWLMLARLCVRFLTDTPAKPAGMPNWQRLVAVVNQWLLYLVLICQPVFGFLMATAHGPFRWFGLIPVWSPMGQSPQAASLLGTAHEVTAWIILALVGLHIAGALYHRIIRRDDTLARMT